jgi:hypothetical protein
LKRPHLLVTQRNRQLRDQVAELTRRLEAAHGELRRLHLIGTSTTQQRATFLTGPCQ